MSNSKAGWAMLEARAELLPRSTGKNGQNRNPDKQPKQGQKLHVKCHLQSWLNIHTVCFIGNREQGLAENCGLSPITCKSLPCKSNWQLFVLAITNAEVINMANIFISYSHKDEVWKTELQGHLAVLNHRYNLSLWDDRKIQIGSNWKTEIVAAICDADIALLLISKDFLISDFVSKEEIPIILESQEKAGLKIIPVLVRPCAWKSVPWLARIQGALNENSPLSKFEFGSYEFETQLSSLVTKIESIVDEIASSKAIKGSQEQEDAGRLQEEKRQRERERAARLQEKKRRLEREDAARLKEEKSRLEQEDATRLQEEKSRREREDAAKRWADWEKEFDAKNPVVNSNKSYPIEDIAEIVGGVVGLFVMFLILKWVFNMFF